MRAARTGALAAVAIAIALLATAAIARGGIWTQVPSGTTAAIDAIEYQGPDRFWFVTDDGRIYRRHPTGTNVELATPYNFNDIAFQATPGTVGLAVTTTGQLYRADTGPWTQVSLSGATRAHLCPGPGGSYAAVTPGGPFIAVDWANNSIAYIVGETGMVLRSQNAGLTWTDISRMPDGSCRVPARIVDVAFNPAAPQVGYFLSDDGRVFRTTDGLATPAQLLGGPFCGPASSGRTIVLDPAAPQRVFQSTWCSGDSALLASSSSGASFAPLGWPFGKPAHEFRDLAFSGGTLIGAGYTDTIATSPDGVNAYLQPLGNGITWHTVDLASPTDAAVGGDGGALALTSQANSVPPPPPQPDTRAPSGLIVGPNTLTVGQKVTYTLQAIDEPGGTGIDPKSYVWTLDGKAAGQAITFTHTYTIVGKRQLLVTFKDRAGHAAGAAKQIVVSRAQATPRPNAPAKPTTPRRTKTKVTFVGQARMTLPPGIPHAGGCTGSARLTPYPHRRHASALSRPANASFHRAPRGSGIDCVAIKKFTVKASRLRRSTKLLDVKVHFNGNSVLDPTTWCGVQVLGTKKVRPGTKTCASH